MVGNQLIVVAGARQFLDRDTPYSPNQRALLEMLNDPAVSGGGLVLGHLAEQEPGSPAQMAAANQVAGDALTALPLALGGVVWDFHQDLQHRLFSHAGPFSPGNPRPSWQLASLLPQQLASPETGGPAPEAAYLFGQAGLQPASPAAAGGSGDAPGAEYNLWAHGTRSYFRVASDGNGPGFQSRHTGMRLGLERPAGAGAVGVAFGFGPGDATVLDRGEARGTVQSTQAAVYGRWGGNPDPGSSPWQFAGAASYGWHTVNSERRIQAEGQPSPATANYRASTWAVEARALRRFQMGSVQVEPGFGFRLAAVEQPGFTETGPGSLEVQRSTFRSQRALVGVRLIHESVREDGWVHTELRLGYEREMGDAAPHLTARLREANSGWFNVRGTDIGRLHRGRRFPSPPIG